MITNEVGDEVALLHDASIALAVQSNELSRERYENEPNSTVRDALFILLHDALILHRGVATLVVSGWSSAAPPLIRGILDIQVSMIAILNGKSPTLNAFRYFYSGFRRLSRDLKYPPEMRRRLRQEIRTRLEGMAPPERYQALQFLKEKDRAYWFSEEWGSPMKVISTYGIPELSETYQVLSAASHGGFLGLRLFRDDPDSISINPRLPVEGRGASLLLVSSKQIVELVYIRDANERLGLEHDCRVLRALIQQTANAVSASVNET